MNLRLDRAFSVGLAHPLNHLLGSSRARIPVLMYHSISEKGDQRHPYFQVHTSSETFSRQLGELKASGFESLTSSEVIASVRQSTSSRKVALTFDDAYADFYTEAFPLLSQAGIKAALYVISSFTADCEMTLAGRSYMSWSKVREVHRYGVEIGSHTETHPKLFFCSSAKIKDELYRSKAVIEDKLGAPVCSFAYPYAFPEHDKLFTSRLRELLQECGYTNGVSTVIGRVSVGTDPYFMPRLPINSFDDAELFKAKLGGGYDWMHYVQYVSKLAKSVPN